MESSWCLGKDVGSIESGASKKNGKNTTPSYGLIDSQSVKTSGTCEERGFDGGKKTRGRKRHIVVDTMGNLVQVIVHDTKAGCDVLKSTAEKCPMLEVFSGDAGYRGTAVEFVENTLQLKLHIFKKIKEAFAVLPVRWIVERTFAWLGNFRRLFKDYEILITSVENRVRIAMIQITIAKCV